MSDTLLTILEWRNLAHCGHAAPSQHLAGRRELFSPPPPGRDRQRSQPQQPGVGRGLGDRTDVGQIASDHGQSSRSAAQNLRHSQPFRSLSPTKPMPKYIIEREILGAGKLTNDQLKGISQKSCGVLQKLGSQIQWLESYVTGDKVYCVYIAPNEEMVREHARQGGFPANRVSEITRMIDPTTAEV